MRTLEVLILVRRGDDFLVATVRPTTAVLAPIAGGVEAGEAFAEAAVRELREETGLEAAVQAARRFAYVRRRRVCHVEAFLVDVEPAGSRRSTGARRVPLAAARGSGRAPLLAGARRAVAEPAVTRALARERGPGDRGLSPASQRAARARRAARVGRRHAATGGSTGSRASCPRACFNATRDTTTRTSTAGSTATGPARVSVIECDWLERFRSARVYAYRLPPDTFSHGTILRLP